MKNAFARTDFQAQLALNEWIPVVVNPAARKAPARRTTTHPTWVLTDCLATTHAVARKGSSGQTASFPAMSVSSRKTGFGLPLTAAKALVSPTPTPLPAPQTVLPTHVHVSRAIHSMKQGHAQFEKLIVWENGQP